MHRRLRTATQTQNDWCRAVIFSDFDVVCVSYLIFMLKCIEIHVHSVSESDAESMEEDVDVTVA